LWVTQGGEEWVDPIITKVHRLHRDLAKADWDTVVFADSVDSFVTGFDAVAKCVDALAASGKDFLASGESACFPWPMVHKARHDAMHADYPIRYRYPNAGVWVATRAGFLREYQKIIDTPADGYAEQGFERATCETPAFHEAVLDQRMAVGGSWCLNLYGLSNAEIEAGLRERPAVVHGSSPENKGKVVDLWRQWRDGKVQTRLGIPRE
jgi:hypothetical protein